MDRAKAIERIMQIRQEMMHTLAFARSGPLLAANLTMTQLKVLIVVARQDGVSGHDLAATLGVGPATLTGIVDRLVAHGLVSRHEDPHDRRIRRVVLSSTGREIVEQILLAGGEHQRRILGRLDAEELAIVERASHLLLDAATAEAKNPSKS
jgi:DNA-binding MarR family transcriptional regulator